MVMPTTAFKTKPRDFLLPIIYSMVKKTKAKKVQLRCFGIAIATVKLTNEETAPNKALQQPQQEKKCKALALDCILCSS